MFCRVLSSGSLAILLALLVAGPAQARPEAPGAWRAAPGVSMRVKRNVDLAAPAPKAAAAAWNRLTAELGPTQAIWDRDTGVPTRVWGAGVPAAGTIASSPAAQRAAHDFLAAHLDLLAPGASMGDFALVGDALSAGIRSLGYAQHYKGRRVVGGQVSVHFKHDRLALIGSEVLPHVQAVLTDSPIAADVARARALAWLRAEAPHAVAGAVSAPVILPLGRADKPHYVEALAVEVRAERPLGAWTVYVDAATGAPLARQSQVVEASGTVRFDVPQRSPSFGDRVAMPAPFLDVTVDGTAMTTDAQGMVTIGDSQVQIELGVRGDLVRIINQAGDLASQVSPLDPDGEVLWLGGADDPHLDAQLTAYVAANFVKEYVRKIATDPLPWLDGELKVSVSDSFGTCNAMSDGNDIYFFDGSAQCENTARIPDVVYHEAGHSVHNQALIPGVGLFEGALSEGTSDYLSATITGDSGVARGFFLSTEPLRELDPPDFEWHWPEHTGEVHDEGRIIGGTLWDLRTELIAELGEAEGIARADLIYYEGIRRASDIPSMYPAALLVDDDDGDLSNGTPNSCVIDQVFHRHGLVGALVLGGRVRTLAQAGDGTVPVELDIHEAQSPCIDLAPTGATLEWRVRGDKDSQTATMTATASGFAAALPAQPDDTLIEYRVIADINDGTTVQFPDNAAYPWYQRYFGPVVPIVCEGFEGDVSGWNVGAVWEIGEPGGKSGDADVAFAGSKIAGTDLSDDGRYDANRVMNLLSPVYKLEPGFVKYRLQYQRWLNVEDGYFDRAEIFVNEQPAWRNLNSNMGDANSNVHHRDQEWSFHDIDITPVSGSGEVQLRFRLTSDAGLEFGGWGIDEVCIVGVEEPVAVCGNGVVDKGEECDDGNTVAGDGCSQTCTEEPANPTSGSEPTTGDGSSSSGGDTDTDTGGATGGGTSEDTGCGCHSATGASGSSAWLLVLAGLGLRRRAPRRRTSAARA